MITLPDGKEVSRYNTELACLLAFSKRKGSDLDALANAIYDGEFLPELYFDVGCFPQWGAVRESILKFLPANFDKPTFLDFYDKSKPIVEAIQSDLKSKQKLHWVGGANHSGDNAHPSDVEFVSHNIAGVSVKSAKGITLSNLTPKRLGLYAPKGTDVFSMFSTVNVNNWGSLDEVNLFIELKRKVFTLAINELIERSALEDEPYIEFDERKSTASTYRVTLLKNGLFKNKKGNSNKRFI